ncbi:MAG: hypothetical protein WC242_00495 [Candidatus Paceibacterota bacterium]|jgi:hypothetical protein
MTREIQRNKPHLNIGTIGHHDHGKTSAVIAEVAITAAKEETKMAKQAVATEKKWQGKCSVCHRVHPLILAMQDPEDIQAINDGRIIPVPGEFMVDIHDFEGKRCPGSVGPSPKTVREVYPKGTMMGVCCSCQSAHLVKEREDFSEAPCPADLWVMMPHNFPGTATRCAGEGTVPQAVFEAQ